MPTISMCSMIIMLEMYSIVITFMLLMTDPDESETTVPDCYDGQVQLAAASVNSQYPSDFYTQITRGYLEVCYQGSWISVCLNNTSNTSTSQLAELACRSINEFGGMSVRSLIAIVHPSLFLVWMRCG